ncbi:MgtC/SapB family protein [Ancylomarina longa]|uniref:MgtC/SapB family protein n=1 Tax=Ancylomarina longa TaxID=2487017 RepID=A0A434AW28_9BACT|nr:MgtC/SapB family protein [Ancylomarina longa]RUT78585.1 MgtC/SapB family protein [Ancylomarina longa]
MDFFNQIISETDINTSTILFRLLFSFLIGLVVGIERERHKQPAGWRTHILICLGSTLLMLLSIYIPQTFQNFQNGDPGRIAAQVVSGIGFLGAGAILKFGVNIKGLTTAASIWVIAALGLAIGAGMYMGAILGAAILLFALITLDALEKKLFPGKFIKRLNIYTTSSDVSEEDFSIILKKHKIIIRTIDLEHSFDENKINYYLTVQISEKVKLKDLTSDLSSISGIKRVKLQQIL